MKKNISILILLSFLVSALNLNGQELAVTDQTINYDDQNQPSVKIILKPNSKTVKKAYKNWMEDKQDVDVDGFGFLKNKDVLKIKKSNLKGISDNKMDLYAKIIDKGEYTEMDVFGSFGYDLHIDPVAYPHEYRRMKTMVYAFLNDFLPGYYKEIVEDTQDLIGDLQEDKSDAKDELADNRKEIEKLKKENSELTNKIKEYEGKLQVAKVELVNQKEEKKKIEKVIIEN